MKINKQIFTKDGFKIKLYAALILFAFLTLSFFFAKNIESALNLRVDLLEHQIQEESVNADDFKVCFIDVGFGNSTYIKFPDGKVMLIDGGNVEYGKKVADVLVSDGVEKIDYLVATHADSDHIAGLNYILEKFEVKSIFRPFQIAGLENELGEFEVYEDEDLANFYSFISNKLNGNTKISKITTNAYKQFITNIYSEYYTENGNYFKSDITVFYDGLKIEGTDYCIEFFSPALRNENYNLKDYSNTHGFATTGYGINNSNDNSAIILIECRDKSFLFTGDSAWTDNLNETPNKGFAEIDFVNSLTEDERNRFENVSVYLMGHHGSSFSSGEQLLELIDAEFFVVSVSDTNSFGHPSPDALARITDYKKHSDYLLMTKEHGTITFCVLDSELCYYTEAYKTNQSFEISWFLLGTIIYLFVLVIIFSIKTSTQKK